VGLPGHPGHRCLLIFEKDLGFRVEERPALTTITYLEYVVESLARETPKWSREK